MQDNKTEINILEIFPLEERSSRATDGSDHQEQIPRVQHSRVLRPFVKSPSVLCILSPLSAKAGMEIEFRMAGEGSGRGRPVSSARVLLRSGSSVACILG